MKITSKNCPKFKIPSINSKHKTIQIECELFPFSRLIVIYINSRFECRLKDKKHQL